MCGDGRTRGEGLFGALRVSARTGTRSRRVIVDVALLLPCGRSLLYRSRADGGFGLAASQMEGEQLQRQLQESDRIRRALAQVVACV